MVSPFEKIFGNTCELRLLEFMLPLTDMDFNISELSEESGVSRTTVGRVVKKFVKWGILNAKEEGIPRYSINDKSPIVQTIEAINNAIIEQMLGEEQVREIKDYIQRHRSESAFNSAGTSFGEISMKPVERFSSSNIWAAGGGCCNELGLMYAHPMEISAEGQLNQYYMKYQAR